MTEITSKRPGEEVNLESSGLAQKKLWNINFYLLLQGQLFSVFGDNIYDIALRVWILAKTESTAIMGVLMAVTYIPRVIISPFAGTFVDRHDRKRVLIISDIICGVSTILIGIAAIIGFLKIWMVVIVGVIVGSCSCFFYPAINSIVPDIVPKSKLIKANSIFSLINTGDNIMGNAIGGFLVQIIGAPISFLVNGVSFLLSAISQYFIKVPQIEFTSNKVSFLQDLRDGFNFIKKSKGLKQLYIILCFFNFFASMSMMLTLPLFKANNNLGIGLYGVAMAINGVGMFLGFTMLSTIEIKKEKRFHLFIISGIITSITMIIYSLTVNFYLIAILFFINGFAVAIINSLIQSSIQISVPSNMRSKAFAFKKTLSSGLMPLGMILAGVLAEKIGMNIVIFVDYIIFCILFVYTYFLSSVKKIINEIPIISY
ncbi:MFS transporter [Oceanirhabdus seepicola]|uniref:MFS transporter n=2 Tax=Oceanirhabdus seepicola TaxID=2828781 RepID=A0A9J6NWV6_9CLOT|nr:MFS transporter [Oceanirhabdus seepicola]